MSIKRKEVKKEDFEALIYTLSCDDTDKKMVDILCREDNKPGVPTAKIEARWINRPKVSSGVHEITGLLSYGPIETKTFKTVIVDIVEGDDDLFTVWVQPVDILS